MCGILGFITEEAGTDSLKRERFIKDALIMDTLRGDDATGIFMVPHLWSDEGPEPTWHLKDSVPGHDFVRSAKYAKELYPIKDWRVVVGHNRAATRGKRNADNAHPFQEGDVTLVHNGTLTTTYGLPKDQWDLNKTRKKEDEISVDSHVICHNLAEHEPDKADEVISKLRGAFALVWHDARDDSVNIVRNDERPLHMAYDKAGKTLFFMSEHEMLYAATKRNNIALTNVFYPKPGVWMKWKNDTPIKSPITKEVELGKYVPYTGTGRFRYDDDYWQRGNPQSSYGYYSGGKWHPTQPYSPPQSAAKASVEGKKEVTPPGKTSAVVPPTDNRIMLLGNRREVPTVHQDHLYLYGLRVEDRLAFLPHLPSEELFNMLPDDPDSLVKVVAQGCLYGGNCGRYSALVYNVPNFLYNRSLGNKVHERTMWTIRPIAIKWVLNARQIQEPVVICHFVSSYYNEGNSWSDEDLDDVFDLPVLDGTTYEDGIAKYPGPHNVMISAIEFSALAENGCAMCEEPIALIDADTVEWVNNFPVCGDCSAADLEEVVAEDL